MTTDNIQRTCLHGSVNGFKGGIRGSNILLTRQDRKINRILQVR